MGTIPLTDEDIVRLALYDYAGTVASPALRERALGLCDGLLAGEIVIMHVEPWA